MFVFVIAFFLVLFAYRKYSRLRFDRLLNDFPCPENYPIIGNTAFCLLSSDNLFKKFRYLAKKHSTYRLRFINHESIVIGTAEDAEGILTSVTNNRKSKEYHFIAISTREGLLATSNHELWEQRRKLITPAFHFKILRKFSTTISEQSERLVEKLKNECTKSKSDIYALVSESALNIICETAMGVSLHSDNEVHRRYLKNINESCKKVVELILSPWLISEWLMKNAPWMYRELIIKNTRAGNELYKCAGEAHDFVNKVIEEKERNFTTNDLENADIENEEFGNKRHFALLDLLLKEKRLGNIDTEGVIDEINTFMAAGYETSATTLTYFLMYVANHNEIQVKIVEELLRVVKNQRKITMEDCQQMNYLERCIKEILRLFPSAPFIARKLIEDTYIGKRLAPAGTIIYISIYDILRDPKYFPKPEVFNPDRFLPENEKLLHPCAYIPFSAGKRSCIGKKFAMLELKIVIAHILLNYHLEPVQKPEDITYLVSVVLQSKDTIYIKFNHRT